MYIYIYIYMGGVYIVNILAVRYCLDKFVLDYRIFHFYYPILLFFYLYLSC